MADEADKAFYQSEAEIDSLVNQARKNSALAPGEPGECRLCLEQSKRLIGRACARCRDENGLP